MATILTDNPAHEPEIVTGNLTQLQLHRDRCVRDRRIFLFIRPLRGHADVHLGIAPAVSAEGSDASYTLTHDAFWGIKRLAMATLRRAGGDGSLWAGKHGHLEVEGIHPQDADTLARAIALLVADRTNWQLKRDLPQQYRVPAHIDG